MAETQQQLRLILDNCSSAFYLVELHPANRFLYANAAAEALLGVPTAGFPNGLVDFSSRIHPDDREAVVRRLSTPGDEKGALLEYRILHGDGGVRWVRDHIFHFRHDGALHLGGFARDITVERMMLDIQRIERDLAFSLASATEMEHALQIVLDAALTLDGVDSGGIYLCDTVTGALTLAVHRGLPTPFVDKARTYRPDSPNARLVSRVDLMVISERNAGSYLSEGPMKAEGLRCLVIRSVRADGRVVAALNLASHTAAELPTVTLTAIDTIASHIGGILGRINAEEALARSRRNLETLFESIDDFLFVLGADGTVHRVNHAVRNRLGYADADLLGKSFLMLHPERHRAEALAILGEMLNERCSACRLPILTRDGREIPVDTKVTRGFWNGEEALFGISRDASVIRQAEEILTRSRDDLEAAVAARTAELATTNERLQQEIDRRCRTEKSLRQHQARLQTLASQASLAEERERRRIATEIHDRLGQTLSLARIRLDILRSSVSDPQLLANCDQLAQVIDLSIEDIHGLTFELSPPILYELGFEAAAEWLVEDFSSHNALSHEIRIETLEPGPPFEIKVMLYQILRELLVNVAKHARAHRVRVVIENAGAAIRLAVTDDGCGFAGHVAPRAGKGGFGLFSIRERLAHLRGRLLVSSASGSGSTVEVEIPIGKKPSRKARR